MEEEPTPLALEHQVTEDLPADVPSEGSGPPVSPSLALASSMSILAAMFLTACIFMVVAVYYDHHKRKRYYPSVWNKMVIGFAVPWQLFPMRNFGDYKNFEAEQRNLLSANSIINMYTSKNKADSKYPKIKRKFPYFVTIPEELEDDQEAYLIQE